MIHYTFRTYPLSTRLTDIERELNNLDSFNTVVSFSHSQYGITVLIKTDATPKEQTDD